MQHAECGMSSEELARVRSAIDNVGRLGDVGDTSEQMLRQILPHCTPEQLEHIETSSKERDLSPITDELWRQHYARKYGKDHVDMVQEKMSNNGCKFTWRLLFKAKAKEQDEMQKKGVARLKELYQKHKTKKMSRQTQPIHNNPFESTKQMKRTLPLETSGLEHASNVAPPLKKEKYDSNHESSISWCK